MTVVTGGSPDSAQVGDKASADPPNHHGNHAETSLPCNYGGRWGDVDEMAQVDAVENGMADTDV
jgi:hypothetical protein